MSAHRYFPFFKLFRMNLLTSSMGRCCSTSLQMSRSAGGEILRDVAHLELEAVAPVSFEPLDHHVRYIDAEVARTAPVDEP